MPIARMLRLVPAALLLVVLQLLPAPVVAQDTRADSAAALLRAARVLEARGEPRLAREVLRVLARRFPDTPGAAEGRMVARQLGDDESLHGFNRSGFVAYHTAFGAWLGVIIPAALDADGGEPYGLGLLVGGPLGFFGSRALAESRQLTSGQAALLQFASTWGTWQGLGWQAALDLGEGTFECDIDVCYDSGSDTAPWAAALVGGVAGIGAGLLASRVAISQGEATVITQSATWATWYGFLAAVLADADGDAALGTALVAGNAGLLLGIPAGLRWSPTAARVRTISAAGLAGGAAGLGVALLASVETDGQAAALAMAGTTAGLVAGTLLTRDRGEGGGPEGGALLGYRGGWRLGMPVPVPSLVAAPATSRRSTVPGIRVPLVQVRW